MFPLRSATIAALLLLVPSGAAAASASQCIEAHEAGLAAERSGELLASRKHFATCAEATCPAVVREECETKLTSISASIPSLVLVVTGAGGDVTAGKVMIDGVVVSERLDGRALEVDPGKRQVEVVTEQGRAAVSLVARQGQRERQVRLTVGNAAASTAQDAPLVHPAAWVAGGFGVAGFAVFAIAGGLGLAKENELNDCAPLCAQVEIDVMRARYLVADLGLMFGVVGLTMGVALGISLAPSDGEQARASLLLGPNAAALRFAF